MSFRGRGGNRGGRGGGGGGRGGRGGFNRGDQGPPSDVVGGFLQHISSLHILYMQIPFQKLVSLLILAKMIWL